MLSRRCVSTIPSVASPRLGEALKMFFPSRCCCISSPLTAQRVCEAALPASVALGCV